MPDPVHHLLVTSQSLNTMKLNLLRARSAHCKIWAIQILEIPPSSIAPMHSLESLKKSLCVLLFLTKLLEAFDSTNVKKSKTYLPIFECLQIPMMKSHCVESLTFQSVALVIAPLKKSKLSQHFTESHSGTHSCVSPKLPQFPIRQPNQL